MKKARGVGRFFVVAVAVAAAAVVFMAQPAVAQNGERILEFRSAITLQQDGSARVVEEIIYDFGANERRGIFRTIPTVYFTEHENEAYELSLTVNNVSREDQPNETTRVTKGARETEIRIGHPDVTISGEKTYSIDYTLSPVVLSAEGEDIFRFDVTGNNWSVPIEFVSVTLTAPLAAETTYCYLGRFGEQGSAGTERPPCIIEAGEGDATLYYYEAPRTLSAGEGFTIEASFPAGSFTQYVQAVPVDTLQSGTFSSQKRLFAVVLLATLFLGGPFVILLWLWGRARYYYRRRKEVVVAQYEPPDDLRPAEVGLLQDNVSNTVELTATLIDVAIRGYMKIEEIQAPKWYRRGKYKLVKLKPLDDLEDFEQTLLQAVFGRKDEVVLNDVEKLAVREAIKEATEELTKRLVRRNLYHPKKKPFTKRLIDWLTPVRGAGRRLDRKLSQSIVAIFVWVLVIRLLAYFMPEPVLAFFGFLIFLWLLSSLIRSNSLYNRMTDEGYDHWARLEGFREFLKVTQQERLKFHNAPKKSPKQFMQYLPYAVALGVEKEWAKQFAGMDMAQQAAWYSGSAAGFSSPSDFVSSLSRGFASSTNSSFASSSSTSSGGSFSGGGFGGGGGGSW